MTSLRMRGAGKDANGWSLPTTKHTTIMSSRDELLDEKRRGHRHCWKRFLLATVVVVLIVIASLWAAKPFFSDWFQEVNFILYHLSRTADSLLLKHRKHPENKIIYYLHLSKCGGTSLLAAASQSGLSAPIRNGLVQRDWRCCGGDDSFEAQAAYAKTSKFDFVANEGDMYSAMDLEHYDYVVTLRDAKSRFKSMWAQWQRDPVLFFLKRRNFTEFCDWFPEDNFMVRKLCGTKCRGKPKYTLTRHDLNYTLHRLEQFTDILFLEDFEASYAKFANKHHWSAPARKKKRSSTSTTTTPEDAWDNRMGALDDALYEFAKRLDDQGQQVSYQFSPERSKQLDEYFLSSEKLIQGSTERN